MKRKISILGSTGSIGRQSLEVIDRLSDKFEIVAMAAGSNIKVFKEQIKKYNPQTVSIQTESLANELKSDFPDKKILWGIEGLKQIAGDRTNDMILVAVTGLNGLYPTLAAIENGIDVALANKETLVAAGNIVMKKAKENNVKILPVDSEHSAVFQCLSSRDISQVKKLIITGSGGPHRTKTFAEIENATIKETLTHPNWAMGDKITVDSATLMNKGLEVIEAYWLFGIDYKDIEVVIHPQSIIHSAVEFLDGSVISQMGIPSMHIPIQYALTYPDTFTGIKTNSLDFTQLSKLEFEKPDLTKFPCLQLAYDAGKEGGSAPVVLNAANEEAVYAFIQGKIKFSDIYKIVYKALEQHNRINNPTLEEIIQMDKISREYVKTFL